MYQVCGDGDWKMGKREPHGEAQVVSGWCASDREGVYILPYVPYDIKKKLLLSPIFLFTVERLIAGL